MDQFVLKSEYTPTGDQPQAIDALVAGIERGDREPQKKPCRSCAVKGNLSRLAWTTPRRNNFGRAWR